MTHSAKPTQANKARDFDAGVYPFWSPILWTNKNKALRKRLLREILKKPSRKGGATC